MTTTTVTPERFAAWRGFRGSGWRPGVDVRQFILDNVTPYEGDGSFLAGPTERTRALWTTVANLNRLERVSGILDADTSTPSTITSHQPGYLDRSRELIVGLQTDAPLKRAIMPNGGLRMVENGLAAYGYHLDPKVKEVFTRYRKTHNDGVFDAYTSRIKAARKAGIITGLPDAYGRGRIIGDYRRVPLYGVDALITVKEAERARLDQLPSSEAVIRDREELAEQLRALQELVEMAATYGFDLSRPARGPVRRRSSGCTWPIWRPPRSRTARRCRWAAPRRFLTSTSSGTSVKVGSPNPRLRNWSTIW